MSGSGFAGMSDRSEPTERMRRLTYRPADLADLESILEFIARDNPTCSLGFTDELRQHCRKLASIPGTIGLLRPELPQDIRSYPFKGYVIFFRYADDNFEVVNVLEGHRDIGAYFRNDLAE